MIFGDFFFHRILATLFFLSDHCATNGRTGRGARSFVRVRLVQYYVRQRQDDAGRMEDLIPNPTPSSNQKGGRMGGRERDNGQVSGDCSRFHCTDGWTKKTAAVAGGHADGSRGRGRFLLLPFLGWPIA